MKLGSDRFDCSGERSSAGRALDCGSSGRGFDPHRSPFGGPLFFGRTLELHCIQGFSCLVQFQPHGGQLLPGVSEKR